MPRFRFENTEFGQTNAFEIELASVEAANQKAIERVRTALVAGLPDAVDQSGSTTKVYDEAGYLIATVNFADVMREYPELQPRRDEPPAEEPGVMRSG
ncbi:hypothetical protein NKH10_30945 [Mesorhizobium sp. M1340]|uniref:DUF6894 family protein n=1 Tax=unclassified Mesorhizobium TaxID=325217 RepID=UPI00333AF634